MFVSEDIKYVGVNDHKIDLFEGQYVVKNGMAYNSYVIVDDKIAVMDTVDVNFGTEWLENINGALGDRKPDYLVVQHMEPDHSANVVRFLDAYPETAIVGNAKTFVMLKQFFGVENVDKVIVSDGDTLELGKHTLTFIFAPMVHWPEVFVTYDSFDEVLFSADGFGKFGAADANEEWDDEARRYYFGIVGKYGAQVQKLLKVAGGLNIKTIAPLHGPVLKDDLNHYIGLYDKWSSYQSETDGVLIAYASVYGNTKKAVMLMADSLEQKGVNVKVVDLCRQDKSVCIGEAFKYNKLVLASITYNGDIFPCMRQFIEGLTERSYQNKEVGIIENGSWAPMAAKIMKGMLDKSKNIIYAEPTVSLKSALNSENVSEIEALAKEMAG